MTLASLSERQKGLLLLSGGVATLSATLLVGRAPVRPQTSRTPDAGVIVQASCGPRDLAFGSSVEWDATARLFVVSDGHECQQLSPKVVLDKAPGGVLVVSDHEATRVCNHLAHVGCAQGPGCVVSAHGADESVRKCVNEAKNPTAASACSPALVCR